MRLTVHSARKNHWKETPFKESTFKLNYVHTQLSQRTNPAAFRITTWIFYGTGRDHQTHLDTDPVLPQKESVSEKTKHGLGVSQKWPVLKEANIKPIKTIRQTDQSPSELGFHNSQTIKVTGTYGGPTREGIMLRRQGTQQWRHRDGASVEARHENTHCTQQ